MRCLQNTRRFASQLADCESKCWMEVILQAPIDTEYILFFTAFQTVDGSGIQQNTERM